MTSSTDTTVPTAWGPQWDRCFLALALYREARGETREARIGVAWCVRTRVERGGWWGNTYSGVLRTKWQFSSLTDPRDPQLSVWPRSDDAVFLECLDVAAGVIGGWLPCPFPGADSYHDTSIPPPPWAEQARKCGRSGKLIFYSVSDPLTKEA